MPCFVDLMFEKGPLALKSLELNSFPCLPGWMSSMSVPPHHQFALRGGCEIAMEFVCGFHLPGGGGKERIWESIRHASLRAHGP